jgi:hypothetical protein
MTSERSFRMMSHAFLMAPVIKELRAYLDTRPDRCQCHFCKYFRGKGFKT